MLVGLNFSAKMLIIRNKSAFSSTPALLTGDSLWASTTFLPLIVTSSRKIPLGMIGSGLQNSRIARCGQHRGDDAGIACAPAKMAAQHFANFILGRMRISRKIVRERHQDAGRTEAALQRVMLLKRPLERVERAVWRCQRFDRRDRQAFGLHGKRQTPA